MKMNQLQLLIVISIGLISCQICWAKNQWQYCIVGAGPAGLQMGYYLAENERDYVIFEQNHKAGKK